MPATKIATCCYCGTRAALVLRGDVRHELACSACGAPLHNMKMLRTDRREEGTHEMVKPSRVRQPSLPQPRSSKKKPKRKKSFGKRLLSEMFDVVEDIFD